MPPYLFYLFAFALSLQTRWMVKAGELNGGFFEYGTLSVFAVDLMGVVIVGWAILKRLPPLSLRGGGPWLFLLFWLLLSLLWNPQPLVAFVWIARLLLALGVEYIFIQEVKTRGQKFLWTCLGWFVFGVTLQAGLGIYQFLTQSTFASKWLGLAFHDPALGGTFVVETVLRRWLRAYGGLPHPNILAAFIVVALVIVVARYAWGEIRNQKSEIRNIVSRVAWLSSFIVLVAGLVLTFSRAGWVAGGLIFLLAWCMVIILPLKLRGGKGALRGERGRPSRLALLTVTAAAIVGMLVVTYPDLFTSRISGDGRLEAKSLNERKTQLAEGWQLFLKRPIQGWGVTAYTRVLHDEVDGKRAVWDYQPAHLVWLTMLVELGAVGVLLVGVWLIVIARRKRKATDVAIPGDRHEPTCVGSRDDSVTVAARHFIVFSLLSTTLLQTLTDHFWWTLPVGMWLAVWIATLWVTVRHFEGS